MPIFKYCDLTGRIRIIDTAKPTPLPVPIYDSVMNNVSSLSLTTGKKLVLCGGAYSTGSYEIHMLTGPQNTEDVVYVHASPKPGYLQIRNVRVRSVGGEDRVYYSVQEDLTPGGIPKRYAIYYLKPGSSIPILYTTINPEELTIANPCSDEYDFYLYDGDFVFGDNDTLYLSSGRQWSGLKCAVYRLNGAKPDTVEGTVTRIHESVGPISGLCFEKQASVSVIYFVRDYDIYKLDLVKMEESIIGQVPPHYTYNQPYDLALAEDAVLQNQLPWWWLFPSGLVKWLTAAVRYVVRIAESLHTGKPTPHPDPRSLQVKGARLD